jgi:hypothetical protein
MSGWDTSSRATWDPEDGQGDSTQAFSTPEFSESDGDRWPESGVSQSRADDQPGYRSSRNGSGTFGYENGTQEPGSAEPPDIFKRDYSRDYGQDRQDFGGYRPRRAAEQDHARRDYEQADFPPQPPQLPQPPQTPPAPQTPPPPQDFTAGRNGIPTGYVPRDRHSKDRDALDRGRDRGSRDYTSLDRPERGRPEGDRPSTDHPSADRSSTDRSTAGREYTAHDYGGRDADSGRSARMDPALQDFFAPRPDRRDPAQPGPVGRHSARGPADGGRDEAPRGFGDDQAAGAGPGQPPRQPRPQGQPRAFSEPGNPFGRPSPFDPAGEPAGPRPADRATREDLSSAGDRAGRDEWASQADRARVAGPLTGPFFRAPGSKALTRGRRPGPRERVLVAAGIVLLVVIGVGLYLVGKGSNNDTGGAGSQALPLPSTTGKASSSTAPTPGAKASTDSKTPPKTAAGFVLSTPATAGGYPLMTAIPSYVQGPSSTTAQAIRSAAVSDGGKVTSHVSAAYQLKEGQVMSFTGYEGTFSPAKVIASLASLGSNGSTYSAGKDGGKLACAVAPGAQPGTVCVWVTTTSLGITEFFSSTGPENVLDQAKTASDTRNFRADVETRRS